MRVYGDELSPSRQSSVDLPERGGSLAWFGVFHELHCIVRMPNSLVASVHSLIQIRKCSVNGFIEITTIPIYLWLILTT